MNIFVLLLLLAKELCGSEVIEGCGCIEYTPVDGHRAPEKLHLHKINTADKKNSTRIHHDVSGTPWTISSPPEPQGAPEDLTAPPASLRGPPGIFDDNYYIHTITAEQQHCGKSCESHSTHWHSSVDGVCVCGLDQALIDCEEESGAIIEVFCVTHQVAEVQLEPRLGLSFTAEPASSTHGVTAAAGNTSQSTSGTTHSGLNATQTSSVNNRTNHHHEISTEGGEEIEAGKKRSKKVLALVLGILCLILLVLGATRVFFQVRKVKKKEKRSKDIKNSLIYQNSTNSLFTNPSSIITRL